MKKLSFNSSELDLIQRNGYQKRLRHAEKEEPELDIHEHIRDFLKAGGKIQHIDTGILKDDYSVPRRRIINRVHIHD